MLKLLHIPKTHSSTYIEIIARTGVILKLLYVLETHSSANTEIITHTDDADDALIRLH